MLVSHFMITLNWAMSLSLVAAGLAPLNSNLQIRNAPGTSSSDTLDTLWAFRRTLPLAPILKRDTTFQNSTSLDTSWDDAVLFSYGKEEQIGNTALSTSVHIVCTTCYIKGTATAQFTSKGNLNVSEAVRDISSDISAEFHNITTTAVNFIKNYFENITTSNILDFDEVRFPPIPTDFDIDVPDIPKCELRFQFDGLELYMQIDTILSNEATYTLNLYTSETPLGVSVGEDESIGVIFSVDLILSVESDIDISSGFHIQLNDGVAIEIPMFDQNVSRITFKGGNFEFLPVKVQSADTVLTAILRVGARVGFEFGTPHEFAEIADDLSFSTGLGASVWADVAQFITNVTEAPTGDGSICELRVVEEYSMLLGAKAGATLAIGDRTWGPTPNTSIPIWYTTIGDACAVTKSTPVTASAAATTAPIVARDDLLTTTTSTEVTYTATVCVSPGLVNCPVRSQSTVMVTSTLTSVVPWGSGATFPATTRNTAVTTIAFGTNIHELTATTGSPTSYVAPTQSSPSSRAVNGKTGGVSNKVIIGVSVGVGVPVLIAIFAGCIYCYRRKRSALVHKADQTSVGQPDLQSPKAVNIVVEE